MLHFKCGDHVTELYSNISHMKSQNIRAANCKDLSSIRHVCPADMRLQVCDFTGDQKRIMTFLNELKSCIEVEKCDISSVFNEM